MTYRVCTKCNIKHEATTEFFHKQKTGKYGLRAECKACCKEYEKRWYKDNPKYHKEYGKQYRKDNPDKINAINANHRATKLNQTPQDANLDMIQFYYTVASTMLDYEVDHIIPLSKGGLHHEDNLQLLEKSLNRQKYDKHPLTEEETILYKGYTL